MNATASLDVRPARDPLTPLGCDLRDFPRMMVDIPRLRGSSFDAITDDSAWRAGFNLWLTAWHQVPAASLDDDEASLAKAAGLGRDIKTWRKVRDLALKGWVRCSDGRLYHETIAEIALEAWIEKLGQRLSSGAGNAKRYQREFDPGPVTADIVLAAALLMVLNPRSKALSRQHVTKALQAPPYQLPVGEKKLPPGDDREATGSPAHVPPGSQEKGRDITTVASPNGESTAQVVRLDPDAEGWDSAVRLLVARGGMTDGAARKFVGNLLKGGLQARTLLPIVGSAMANETRDPKAYLTRAVQAAKERAAAAAQPKRVGFV